MLKQQAQDRQSEWQHAPRIGARSDSAARFDQEAAREIIATAAQLQAEQDTLSQAEIETLAAEVGIEPRHVRQAIALSQGQAEAQYQTPELSRAKRRQLLLFVPALYILFLFAAVGIMTGSGGAGANALFFSCGNGSFRALPLPGKFNPTHTRWGAGWIAGVHRNCLCHYLVTGNQEPADY